MGPVFVSHIWRIIECDTWSLLPPELKPQAVRVSANLKPNQWEPNGGFNIFLIDRFQNLSPNTTRGRRGHPLKNTPNHTTSTSQDTLGLQMNFLQLAVPKLDVSTNFYGNLGCLPTRDGFLPRAFRTSGSALASKRSCTKCGRPKKQAKPQVWIPFWVTRGSVGLCYNVVSMHIETYVVHIL